MRLAPPRPYIYSTSYFLTTISLYHFMCHHPHVLHHTCSFSKCSSNSFHNMFLDPDSILHIWSTALISSSTSLRHGVPMYLESSVRSVDFFMIYLRLSRGSYCKNETLFPFGRNMVVPVAFTAQNLMKMRYSLVRLKWLRAGCFKQVSL